MPQQSAYAAQPVSVVGSFDGLHLARFARRQRAMISEVSDLASVCR